MGVLKNFLQGSPVRTEEVESKIREVGSRDSMMFAQMLDEAESAERENSIPKFIHKIWWQGIEEMPDKYLPPLHSWVSMNPNWQVVIWNENAVNKLMREFYPEYVRLMNDYPRMIQKIDAAKYFILSKFGGCYSDMDQHCINPIEQIVDPENERAEMVCSSLTEKPLMIFFSSSFRLTSGPYVNNAFIMCKPSAQVWKHVFAELVRRQHQYYMIEEIKVLNTTGPVCFTRGIRQALANEYESKMGIQRQKSWPINTRIQTRKKSMKSNYEYTSVRFVDSKVIDPFSIYFKMGRQDHFESIMEHIVDKNQAVCISYEASSWTKQNWYGPAVKRVIHYLHKKEIREIQYKQIEKKLQTSESFPLQQKSQPRFRRWVIRGKAHKNLDQRFSKYSF